MAAYVSAVLPVSTRGSEDGGEAPSGRDCKPYAEQRDFTFHMDEQRQAALQKLVAVRNFAHADCEPCRVIDGLYVGSLGAARNADGLRKRGVTHVVNASPIVPCFHRGHFRYKALPVYDDAEEDIGRYFAESCRFIARGRRKGGVLVHCYAGQSRSVAFVLAYLCSHQGLSLADAYALVLAARPCARPNAGFMRQLAAFERELCEEGSPRRRRQECTCAGLLPSGL